MNLETPPAVTGTSEFVRYTLESGEGLLVNTTADHGPLLLLWSERELAERMAPAVVGAEDFRLVSMKAGDLCDDLASMQQRGMRFVVLDMQPESDGIVMPIELALSRYRQIAEAHGAISAADDHFVQRLDRLRAMGEPIEPSDERLPLDCPHCRAYQTVPDADYRAWREGRREVLACDSCQSAIGESEFGRVRCADCGRESGWMPQSLCRGIRHSELPWRCLDCGPAAVARLANRSTIEPRNWYSLIVGSAAAIALMAGLFVKFVLMADK